MSRICAHCLLSPAKDSGLCCECEKLPRCRVCEVFFDGLVSQSQENPERCDGCLDMEEKVKLKCSIYGCDETLPLYASRRGRTLHYVVRGNNCASCSGEAKTKSKQVKKREHPQFVGYLAFIEPFYLAGRVNEEQWRYAIRMNRHDVTRWNGIEDIREELEEEFEDLSSNLEDDGEY